MRQLYAAVEPLQQQKEALLAEKKELETQYKELLRDPSTVEILFRELDKSLYTDVYPLMRDRGITGVLGLSLNQYPGLLSQITKEQYIRLIKDGWGSCLIFQDGYNLEAWLYYLKTWVDRDELEFPTTIFFPSNNYDSETMDAVLEEYGINTILLNAENGHSSTVTRIEGFWFTGAMPWNYTGINSDLELLSYVDGGNLAFTVSFEDMWDAFEQKPFITLMETLKEVLVVENLLEQEAIVTPTPTPTDQSGTAEETTIKPQLNVTSFNKAREAHLTSAESENLLIKEREDYMRDLDAQIEDINNQVSAIYDAWSKQTGIKLSNILG